MTASRISVVVAVRNGAGTLARALDSVLEQTHPDVELVVMDGASTDGTRAILERYGSRIAYWESEPDRGVYHAWNKALDHVTGDWILFLGADDTFAAPTTLEGVVPELAAAAPGLRVAYGEVEIVGPDGAVTGHMGRPWPETRALLEERMPIPHSAAFHRRELFDVRGRFDDRFRIAGDYELLLRELLTADALFIPRVLVHMGVGGLSSRTDLRVLRLREAERARRMHGLPPHRAWRSGAMYRAHVAQWIRRLAGENAERRVMNAYRRVRGRLDRRMR